MKNTLKNKQQIFDHYIDQKVFINKLLSTEPVALKREYVEYLADWTEDSSGLGEFISLKPLSEITDEEALWISDKRYGDQDAEMIRSALHIIVQDTLYADYLRKRGYAVPYLDISVDEQVEFGWVELKAE